MVYMLVYTQHLCLPIQNALKVRKANSAVIRNLPHMKPYGAAQILSFSTNDF